MSLSVLVIDDEADFLQMLHIILTKAGYKVTTTTDAREGLQLAEKHMFDLCLCDLKMPNMDGMEFLESLRKMGIQTTVIVMSAYGDNEMAIRAMKAGAYDYINKPFTSDEIVLTLRKAEEREQLRRENRELRTRIAKSHPPTTVVAKSEAMRRIVAMANKIAQYKSTVLLTGESGSGKEVIARLIHESSSRSKGPFVPVNCGAIPEHLMESEFFGHLKGAFTDAYTNKKGLIETAQWGTLFLDEVGELPLQLQVKILRFLQESEIRRIGDTKPIKVDVRVIAATAKNLDEEVAQGRFREDLFYRLNVVPIRIPPLRERVEDIPALVDFFLMRTRERLGLPKVMVVQPDAMNALMSYSWPGNVRELENVIERAIVLAEGDEITLKTLPENIRSGAGKPKVTSSLPIMGMSVKRNQKALEKMLIEKALEEHGGNRTKAAKALEISHRALLYKIKEYGLDKEEYTD